MCAASGVHPFVTFASSWPGNVRAVRNCPARKDQHVHTFRLGRTARIGAAGSLATATALALTAGVGAAAPAGGDSATATPIKHLVVIFQENVSFDHYFGTYPNATNTDGSPFTAAPGTPTVNGLSGGLLTSNPNSANPQRLGPDLALTCDQDHDYTDEQEAFDHGLMDGFVQHTNNETCSPPDQSVPNLVMDYYDGNTVTALWNYAQQFAMSDNSYGTTFGPSSPGAVNVTAGNTYGAICGPDTAVYNSAPCSGGPFTTDSPPTTAGEQTAPGTGTMYSDADPYYDICSYTQDKKTAAKTIKMGGKNIGDLLSAAGVSWGWFQGGFASPGYTPGQPSTDDLSKVCTGTTTNVGGAAQKDYNPHHQPFEYYASTANPAHTPPASIAEIGHDGQANHQYDLRDFFAAADAGDLPAVSYLKAPDAQDGHAGYSDPLDEQKFLADTINHLEQLPTWKSTAVVIAYDDSDGWYDHQMGPILTQSQTPLDALSSDGMCGSNPPALGQQAKCGVGPRLPLLVVSPMAKHNFVDGTVTTQTSVVRFIEDNWLNGQRIGDGSADEWTASLNQMFDFRQHANRTLFLDPTTGEPQPRGRS